MFLRKVDVKSICRFSPVRVCDQYIAAIILKLKQTFYVLLSLEIADFYDMVFLRFIPYPGYCKTIVWNTKEVPHYNNAAYPKHQEEGEISPDRNYILTCNN